MDIEENIIFIKQAKAKREELIRLSETEEEVKLLKQIAIKIKEVYGKNSAEYIEILNELGGTAKYIGEYDMAINAIEESKDIILKYFSTNKIAYATALINLAEVYRYKGELDKILELYLEAKLIYEENNKIEDYNYAGVCNNLGLFYQEIKKYDKSLELHKISYKILKNFDKNKIALATTLSNMAVAYGNLNFENECESCIKECIEIYEKEVGTDHYMYSVGLNNLAILYYQKDNLEKSLELFEKCLLICENSFGKNGVNYIKALENVNYIREEIKKREKRL